jgi:DNA-binding SARP family transcriptional activator
MAQALQLTMIGGFRLTSQGRQIRLPHTVECLVAFLALHDGPATRPIVAGNLWLDTAEERAAANLRSALWRLRRLGLGLIQSRGEQLALADDVRVDLHELRKVAHDVITGGADVVPTQLDQLSGGGDLLGDWYEDWVMVERERFRQLRLQALERSAVELAERRQFGRAVAAALAAVASEPLRESAHRALIRIHQLQGNQGEALRQYCIYRRLMQDELELEPSEQMERLIGRVPRAALERYGRRDIAVTHA